MGIKCPKCHHDNPDDTIYCGKCSFLLNPADEASLTKTIKTPAPGLDKGKTIAGKYRIVGRLGAGGMGVVYKALDLRLERTVALKFLPQELTHDSDARERFIQEAKAASALEHNNICTIYEIDETEDEQVFIAMACYEGESLKERIQQGPIDPKQAMDIAIQIAQGLAKAHRQGIVHRDVKPSNLLITEDDVVKIVDFGLAKLGGQARLTRTGTTMGTVAYMSPEQAENKTTNHQTDIWSLGVVFYEMLTGELPFEGEQEASFLYSIVHKNPKPMKDITPKVSELWEEVVYKALAKSCEKRYQHMDELLADLKLISEGLEPEKAKEKSRKAGLSRVKRTIIYAGIIGVIAILTVIALNLLTSRTGVIDSIAVLPMKNLSGDPEQDHLADGITAALSSQLSQIRTLQIISHYSMMRYRNSQRPLPEIAKELNVDAFVTGNVICSGDKIRIAANLVDGETERNLWNRDYERNLTDVLIMQKEVARAITKEVNAILTPEESARLASARQINPKAYEAYSKGSFHLTKRTEEGFKLGLEYLHQAIEIDPNYALAHVKLAELYQLLPVWWILPPENAIPKAKEAAFKAIEIDDSIAEAHAILGFIKFAYEWDWEGAEKTLKHAMDLNPGCVDARLNYARYLSAIGRHEEALAESRRTLEVDPISLFTNTEYGISLYFSRQYDKAIEQLKKTLELDRAFPLAHTYLCVTYLQKSMFEEALEACKNAGPYAEYLASMAHAKAGRKEDAQKMTDKLVQIAGDKTPASIAGLFAQLGEKDKAFEWLEKGYEQQDFFMHQLKVEPMYDPLRDDPRFKDLLRRMNSPDVE